MGKFHKTLILEKLKIIVVIQSKETVCILKNESVCFVKNDNQIRYVNEVLRRPRWSPSYPGLLAIAN